MKPIFLVAPMPDAYDKALELIREKGYDNIEVELANMGDGVAAARRAIRAGAEIIVTRGGTYRLCRAAFDLPVVEIHVSAYDILESVQRAGAVEGPVAVVGYNNVVDGFDLLRELLPFEIIKVELHAEDQVLDVISQHRDRGIRTYIGDANVTRITQALGCRGIVIFSQKDSIMTAMREARRIHRAARIEKQRTQQITTITDFVHDGILAIDEREMITILNARAAEVFGVDRSAAIGRNVREVIPNTLLHEVLHTGIPQLEKLQTVRNCVIATNRVPIIVDGQVKGAVATFQDVTEMQKTEQTIRRKLLKKGFTARYRFEDIVGESPQMKECIEAARRYALYDTPVLICGESGVGKELFAQSIHNASPRAQAPFVAVNCAALPPALIESELFGYEEGSFTGAKKEGRAGVFELAHGGTLLLDEISEIPLPLQGRLLRVLQEKEVMRIGADKVIPVDVKIICASNRDLQEMVRAGTFRRDLYFRISILLLSIPPLRERPEDIMLLARHFNQKYAEKYEKRPLVFHERARRCLSERYYEGNVRELGGLIERCIILSSFAGLAPGRKARAALDSTGDREFLEGENDLRAVENWYIQKIYHKTDRNIKKTCEILKIDRSTLWRKLKDRNASD